MKYILIYLSELWIIETITCFTKLFNSALLENNTIVFQYFQTYTIGSLTNNYTYDKKFII